LAQEYGVTQLQFFGDSPLVIQRLRKEASLRNFSLQPLFDAIQQQIVDGLSKKAFGAGAGYLDHLHLSGWEYK
jgi:hypothetical protein